MSTSRAMVVMLAAFTAVLGCDSGPPPHPDTGAGAGETAPATINCLDFCLREAERVAPLCNEDKMTTVYTALADQFASQCSSVCSIANPDLSMGITAVAWQCLFQSSCRQVFEHDACHVQAHYSCS